MQPIENKTKTGKTINDIECERDIEAGQTGWIRLQLDIQAPSLSIVVGCEQMCHASMAQYWSSP